MCQLFYASYPVVYCRLPFGSESAILCNGACYPVALGQLSCNTRPAILWYGAGYAVVQEGLLSCNIVPAIPCEKGPTILWYWACYGDCVSVMTNIICLLSLSEHACCSMYVQPLLCSS